MRIKNNLNYEVHFAYAGNRAGWTIKPGDLGPVIPLSRLENPTLRRDFTRGHIDLVLDDSEKGYVGLEFVAGLRKHTKNRTLFPEQMAKPPQPTDGNVKEREKELEKRKSFTRAEGPLDVDYNADDVAAEAPDGSDEIATEDPVIGGVDDVADVQEDKVEKKASTPEKLTPAKKSSSKRPKRRRASRKKAATASATAQNKKQIEPEKEVNTADTPTSLADLT